MAKRAIKAKKQPANKTQQILGMLQRPSGASIPELIKATEWQAHSVRGFLAGTVRKRMGLDVTSTREGGKDRRYRIAGAQ